MNEFACSGSVTGHGSADRDGRCPWCLRRMEPPLSRPVAVPSTDLGDAYGYFYDPDFGSGPLDAYAAP